MMVRKLREGRRIHTKAVSQLAKTGCSRSPIVKHTGTWNTKLRYALPLISFWEKANQEKWVRKSCCSQGLEPRFPFCYYKPFPPLQSFPTQNFTFKCFSFFCSPWNNNIWNHSRRESTFCEEINLTCDRKKWKIIKWHKTWPFLEMR